MSDYGYVGRILRVDLGTREATTLETPPYEKYLGGAGIASRIYYDEVGPEVEPFDAENRLIFMTGPFAGTPVPSSGRSTFYSKSPVGYPAPVCRPSSMGGAIGAELKYAGFDGLILQGASERPVYLWIHDGGAEICDAADLWGLDTFETQKILLERHDPRASAAVIGPSGENLGRMASIVHGTGYASGMSGFGAIMGAKKLKGFVVRGTGGVKVAHPARLLAAMRRVNELVYDPDDPPRMHGMRGLGSHFPGGDEFMKKHNVGAISCHACPIACQGVFKVPGTPLGADCCVWPYAMYVGFPEGEAGWKAIWDINVLVNRLGLSIWESHQNYQFVIRLRDAGLIDDATSGLPLNGEPTELIKSMLEQIAHRRDLGALLAEQLPRAAASIGKGADKFVIDARGWPILLPWDDPRGNPMMTMQPLTGGHFPYTDGWFFWSFDGGSYQLTMGDSREALSEDEMKSVAERVFGDRETMDLTSFAGKAAAVRHAQNYHALADSLGFCTWVLPVEFSCYDDGLRGDMSVLAELYASVLGTEIDEVGIFELGERAYTMERMQGVRQGYHSRESDFNALKKELYNERSEDSPLPGGVLPEEQVRAAVLEYYDLRGWDRETGIPLRETLQGVGLGELAEGMPADAPASVARRSS